jgi:predicted nucleic acid-binding protein
LLEAKERGLITAVKPLPEALITQARFRIHADLVKDALQRANEA